MRLLLLLCLGLGTACSTLAQNVVRPSVLNRAAAELNGKRVVAEGWMIIEAEEVALWDSQEDRNANRHPDRCVSLLIPHSVLDQMKPLSRVRVSVSGTFHKDVGELRPTMFYGLCNTSAIEVDSADAVGIKEGGGS